MISETRMQMKIAFKLLIVFIFLVGLIYPLIVTGLAQILFPQQVNGDIIYKEGRAVGSLLIGQSFTDPKYFWGRPSSTQPFPYNAKASSGSNLGPSNPILLSLIQNRSTHLTKYNPKEPAGSIPVDLVTASGSGLDPEISPRAAFYQVARVAKARGLEVEKVQILVKQFVQNRTFGILGEPRVNVLKLNLALDNLSSTNKG